MDPPVDVPATPTRCIFGQLSRVILGRRMRKRKKNKKERKKVDMFTQLFRQIVYTFENVFVIYKRARNYKFSFARIGSSLPSIKAIMPINQLYKLMSFIRLYFRRIMRQSLSHN